MQEQETGEYKGEGETRSHDQLNAKEGAQDSQVVAALVPRDG